MNKINQEEFLKLWNKFSNSDSLGEDLKHDFLDWKRSAQLCSTQLKIDSNFVLKIFCIYHTNAFCDGSLAIETSKFNHSCSPNADFHRKNSTTNEVEIRATTKVKKGEEISINWYDDQSEISMKNVKERQLFLLRNWGFICSCELCQEEKNNQGIYENRVKNNRKNFKVPALLSSEERGNSEGKNLR